MGTLKLSRKERDRLEVLGQVKAERISVAKAAELMKVSYRHAKRIVSRFAKEGHAGLVHRLRGRKSNRGGDPQKRQRVLILIRAKYWDFGPTLAAEYLAEEDNEVVGVETLRRWMMQDGQWQPRRRGGCHRRWRARKAHRGEMVQGDGSRHDWFEGRRGWAVLIVLIDDATNFTYARFFEEETTAAVMETFLRYVRRHGLPRSLYVDRDSIYRATRDATADETLADRAAETQFARAMRELGVELILAHSPQAKGRVERRHGVFQDRLVKALRRRGIATLEAANEFLEGTFLPDLNQRFTQPAAATADLHRRVPRGVNLDRVLSYQETRVVQNDWTLSWRNRWFQLSARHQSLRLVKQRVTVCEQLDGTLRILYRGRELSFEELPARPTRRRARRPQLEAKAPGAPKSSPGRKPGKNHPWRTPRRSP